MAKRCRSCCGPTVCNTQPVTVQGCNVKAVQGATVQLKSGTTVVDTQATDGTGSCTLTAATAGTYTISVTPPASSPWWSSTAVTRSVTIACTGTQSTQTMTLNPATGYACRCTGCRDPLDNGTTLFPSLTDANGTYAMQWDAGNVWTCCYLLPGQALFAASGAVGVQCVASAGTGSVAISYQLGCGGSGVPFQLIQTFTACNPTSPFKALDGNCSNPGHIVPFANQPETGNLKLQTSGSFAASVATAPNNCNGSLSFTVTGAYVNGTVAVSF